MSGLDQTGAADAGRAELLHAAQKLIAERRFDEGEYLLARLANAGGRDPDVFNALAAAALGRGRAERAFEILAPIATEHPDHAGVMGNLGTAHMMAGRGEEAEVCFRRAHALAPNSDSHALSLALMALRRVDVAAARRLVDEVVARAPDNALAWSMRGAIALAIGDFAGAEAPLVQALSLDPNDVETLRRLSATHLHLRRADDALRLIEQARLLAPLDVDCLLQLASCQMALGRLADAEASCRELLAFGPANRDAQILQWRLQIVTGRSEAAVAAAAREIRDRPQDVEAMLMLAGLLRLAGRPGQAIALLDHALSLDPRRPDVRFARIEAGLALGEWRPPGLSAAAPLPDDILLPAAISAEDVIVFARYLTDGADRPPRRVAASPEALAVLSHVRGKIVASSGTGAVAASLAELAAAHGPHPETVPYLAAESDRRRRWLAALSEFPRPWLGVAFDGEPLSLDAARLTTLVSTFPGTVVSLAVGEARRQLAAWPEAIDAGLHFADAAEAIAAIDCLDMVVGPDGVAMHIAGALDRPGVAIVASNAHWAFAGACGRSLWYPSLHVARQAAPADWPSAVAAAAAPFAGLVAALLRQGTDGDPLEHRTRKWEPVPG
ncbi:MAG: tetratricopeptide repeat protein [Ancalomicrobiaceae bacterium]|nr:tetratricopeptide repeat protein [Ancalomicrobiaceae bacterium]